MKRCLYDEVVQQGLQNNDFRSDHKAFGIKAMNFFNSMISKAWSKDNRGEKKVKSPLDAIGSAVEGRFQVNALFFECPWILVRIE